MFLCISYNPFTFMLYNKRLSIKSYKQVYKFKTVMHIKDYGAVSRTEIKPSPRIKWPFKPD